MKKTALIRVLLSITVLMFAFSISAQAAEKQDLKECKIKTDAHCGVCKAGIEGALNKLDGVSECTQSLDEKKILTVKYDASKTSTKEIMETVNKVGFKTTLMEDGACKSDCKTAKKSGCCNKKHSTIKPKCCK